MYSRKNFLQFVAPSVLAFALSGVYTIVDGFFVGRSLGDMGLAAITLGYPIAAAIQAIGTGIGLAGAIRYTILKAQKDDKGLKECFGGTSLLMLLVSLLIMGILLGFLRPLLGLLGAKGEVLQLTTEYIRIIALGTAFQLLATGLVPFIRNMGGAVFAMAAMMAGFASNIVLDYLFVWVYELGMAGAAWATIIGQAVTMMMAVFYLTAKKIGFHLPPRSALLGFFCEIIKVALAPFGLTFSPNITIVLINRFLLLYGSEQSVAVYSCIGYVTSISYLLLQGVGDGCQPLVSKYYGEENMALVRQVRSLAYQTGAAVIAACIVLLFAARNKIGVLFGASSESCQEVAMYLPLFLSTMLFLSFVRITTSYLYATEKTGLSYLLVYAEPVLLLIVLLTVPPMLGLTGVWLAVPLAQLFTWVISVSVKRTSDRCISS